MNDYLCVLLICFVVEFIAKLSELWRGKVPSSVGNIERELLVNKEELSRITSVQLEFVKHSKLTRHAIKLEKQLVTEKGSAYTDHEVEKIFAGDKECYLCCDCCVMHSKRESLHSYTDFVSIFGGDTDTNSTANECVAWAAVSLVSLYV